MELNEVLTPEEEALLQGPAEGEGEEAGQPAPESPTEPPGETAPPAAPETPAKPPPKMVPLAAVQGERQRAQEAEARLRRAEDELAHRRDVMARIEERFKMAQEQAPKPQLPDPDEDPLGYERAKREQIERELAETRQRVSQFEQGFQQRQEIEGQERQQQQKAFYVQGLTQQFASKAPDYYDAVQFMLTKRAEELEVMGYSDENARNAIIANEATLIVDGALGNQKNPAEVMYSLAKRWGWGAEKPAQQPNGLVAPKLSPSERVESLQKGVGASRSLSNQSGTESQGISLEKLAAMSQDEFDAVHKRDPALIERLMRELS